jgi:pyruvate/2-oxoglutarate dehydrogenase complex dihydrolipoamide acyltransferase (E2) component
VMELAVAFVFVDISVHVGNSGLMVAAALAFTVLAVTARGPLGIVRICRPWLHLTLVMSVAVVVALAPVIPAVRPDIEGIIVIEFGALGLIRLATLTDMNPSRRSRSRRSDRTVIEATATVGEASAPAPAIPPPARTPSQSSATGAAARWAGRATGAVSASGRKAVADHGPEASRQVKRAIRGAGRLTGRVTSPTEPGPGPDSGGQTGSRTGD